MKTLGQQQAQTTSQLKQGLSGRQKGTCVSIDWPNQLAVVNVRGGTPSMPFVSPPIPQRACWVAFLGQQPLCLGPVLPPSTGTVAGAASAGLLPVTGDDEVAYQLAYDDDLTFTTGDRVLINTASGGVVVCRLSADPVTHDPFIPSPPVIPPSHGGSQTFQPFDSGTQNGSGSTGSGSWGSETVWCGDSTLGAYFYRGIDDSIPDGATITEARIYLHVDSGYGNSPSLATHALASKSGNVSMSNKATISGGSGWKDLTAAQYNALKTGSAKGLGTDHGGFWIYSAAGQNNSGALYMKWST